MSEKHAIMKFNVAVGRLILDGRVVRRYDDHGKAIYFTVDHPDIEKHAESLDKARVQRYKELRLRRIISEETE